MATSEERTSEISRGHASWVRLSEGLVAGVHHTLNNRMAALSAVAQVLEADLAADHPLAGAMSKELQRLEGTASLLALLGGHEGPEPVQLPVVVEEAAQLFEMHHSLRDLRLELDLPADLYPLWISPAALRRAVLVMLALAGERARAGEPVVAVGATGSERVVELTVRAEGPDDEFTDAGLAGVTIEGAGALLGRWGGEVAAEDTADGLVLRARLLTLPEARSREAAAS